MKQVEFLDLGQAYLELKNEIDQAIAKVVESGRFILGPEVDAFESAFARYCDAQYAVGVGNGLEALRLALIAMGIGHGDEVIVPSNTFIATWLAVSQCGAIPVPVEPYPNTFNLDVSLIERAITKSTKIILPVHLYGQPADLDPIISLAKNNNLLVLEDAAQAHGAKYKGRRIGAHADAVAWSFYPSKNLGAMGDAGAVTTDDPDIADRIRVLQNYGSRTKYFHDVKGYNSRLDPLQAAILRVKLNHLDDWNSRRCTLANAYIKGLKGSGAILPDIPNWANPVWHLFVIRHPFRNELQQSLGKVGIESFVHYPVPPHRQTAYRNDELRYNSLSIAERLASEVLSLPIGPHLSLESVDYISAKIVELEQN